MARTVIDIKEELLIKAKKFTGLNKKVDIVNYALKKLIEQAEIEKILNLKGQIKWEGDKYYNSFGRCYTCLNCNTQ